MDYRLKIFYNCATQKSFTAAAKILNMTQPAVTFQIKNLEEEFKTSLFVRDGNKIRLTHPGKILFKHAENIFREYDEAKQDIYQVTKTYFGEIRIGIVTVLSKYLLPRLIGHFKQKYPNVEIKMLVGNSKQIMEELKMHSLDFAVVSEPIQYKRLAVKPFIDDELLVIVNPQHPWALRDSVELKELITEPFVDRELGSGSRATYEKFFTQKGVSLKQFNVVMTMGSVEAVKSYVESGMCYGIVSSIAVRNEINANILNHVKVRGAAIKRKFLIVHYEEPFNKHLIDLFWNTVYPQI